jgi:CheY-like chemotaxis protein
MIEIIHRENLKAIVANGYTEVLNNLGRFEPIAMILDVGTSLEDKWNVLDLVKKDISCRHIPVHVVSAEDTRLAALKRGARSFLRKPFQNGSLKTLLADSTALEHKETRSVLIVEDNEVDSSQIAKIVKHEHISVHIASTAKAALNMLASTDFDCMILDYTLPDMNGIELLRKASELKKELLPVIVYSAKDFSKHELQVLEQCSSSVLLKGARSLENLLDETVSHLYLNHNRLSPEKQKIIEHIRKKQDVLAGKTILVVDDDERNLFALTTVFERFGIHTITAESGREAIQVLKEDLRVDMILVDIMMPEMDGYETIQKIRHEHNKMTLPIIAVTAKVMKEDRQKCIESGASDYITKPLKVDQLLSLMRLWFYS